MGFGPIGVKQTAQHKTVRSVLPNRPESDPTSNTYGYAIRLAGYGDSSTFHPVARAGVRTVPPWMVGSCALRNSTKERRVLQDCLPHTNDFRSNLVA